MRGVYEAVLRSKILDVHPILGCSYFDFFFAVPAVACVITHSLSPRLHAACTSSSGNPATRPRSKYGGSAWDSVFQRAISMRDCSARSRICSRVDGSGWSVRICKAITARLRSDQESEFSISMNQVGEIL